MANNQLYGWDLTFKTVENDLKRKSDVLIAFIHWNLTRRGFRSIGVGDERTLSGDEDQTELLPIGWNDTEKYTIRYLFDNTLYILHGMITEGNLIVNLMRSEDLAVTNIAFNVDDTVKELKGPLDKLIPNNKELIFNIRRDLVDSITAKAQTTVETQTRRESASNSRRAGEDPPRAPRHPPPHPDHYDIWEPPPGFQGVGRADLDPFAGGAGAGGMLFNPFLRRDNENPGHGIPGGLPRGAVPPGARFDPFAPPAAGGGAPGPQRRPPPPDADHLPPPGFNDHMFM